MANQQKKLVAKAKAIQRRIDNAPRPPLQKITFHKRATTGRKR